MTSSNGTVTTFIPNPYTPLAYLNPEQAYQTTVTNYASVGALAVLIWDILENGVADYYLLKSRFNISLIAYFASRTGVMGYMLSSAIFSSAPTGHCVAFDKEVNSWCPLAITCSAFLFFLRLRAVYNRNRIIVATFLALWFGLLAATILIPLGVVGGAVGPQDYCEDAFVANTVSIVQLTPLAYDTLVFIAISWRLCRIASVEPAGPRETFQVMLFGKHLPTFAKSILLDGQLYYLTTLLAGVTVLILTYSPGVPGPLRTLATDPYRVIVNIMACRVYRRTRMGMIRELEISTTAMDKAKLAPVHPMMRENNSENTLDTAPPHIRTLQSTTSENEKGSTNPTRPTLILQFKDPCFII